MLEATQNALSSALLPLAGIVVGFAALFAWGFVGSRRDRLARRNADRDYQSIFDNAIDGIYRSSPEGKQLRANPALVRLNGYESEEEMLRSVRDIATEWYVEPRRRAEFMRILNERGVVENFVSEVYRHKTRERIWVSENARLVRDAAGRPLFYEGTIRDITALRRAEEALIAASRQAEAANRAKSELLARVSHELRTPLNAILGFSDILRNEMLGELGQARYKEFSQDIYDSGRHLLALINDILDLSKIEAGRLELHEELVSVAELFETVRRLVAQPAAGRGLAFEIEIPAGLPSVRADKRALKQVLLNLVSNAVKFTPAGGRIRLEALLEDDGGVGLRVRDTGIGIAAADIPKALEPFGQVDGVQPANYEGAGLGLPISRALVEMHRGGFELASQPGVGTTVTVHLPRERVAA